MFSKLFGQFTASFRTPADTPATDGAAGCDTMLSRFQGKEGMRRLITALMKQDIVENNRALAAQIARLGVLECVQAETNFIVQDAKDNDIFFIVSGQADIFVNDKRLRSRKDGECVGEMAAIDPAKPRAATVRARTELVYVRLSEPCFRTLSNRYPKMWSPIAKTLGDRLRQRNGFHKVPNPKPIVFIGSSTESSPLADAIKAAFLPDEVKVLVWTQDVFGPSSMTLDTLLEHAREVDFAAFIFSPDDKVTSRRKSKMGPRDNVIFELGLFMGQLERERTFVIAGPEDVKIPSDLLGLTQIRIDKKHAADPTAGAAEVASQIMGVVNTLRCR